MRPLKDSRGREIRPGQVVAYNRSGDVIEGEVTFVGTAVTIKPHPDFQQGRDDTRKSRVRNPRGVLILDDPA